MENNLKEMLRSRNIEDFNLALALLEAEHDTTFVYNYIKEVLDGSEYLVGMSQGEIVRRDVWTWMHHNEELLWANVKDKFDTRLMWGNASSKD
jgi:hypothetical protein